MIIYYIINYQLSYMTLKPWSFTQAWINSHWTPRLDPFDCTSSFNFSFRRRSGCRGSDRVRGGDDQANDDISDDDHVDDHDDDCPDDQMINPLLHQVQCCMAAGINSVVYDEDNVITQPANQRTAEQRAANQRRRSSIRVMLFCLLPFYVDNNHLLWWLLDGTDG